MKKLGKQQILSIGSAFNVILVCSFLGLFACGYLWQRQQVGTLGRDIKKHEETLEKLVRENERYRNRLAELNSVPYLDARVKELGLKLIQPEEQQIVRITEAAETHHEAATPGQFAQRHLRLRGDYSEDDL